VRRLALDSRDQAEGGQSGYGCHIDHRVQSRRAGQSSKAVRTRLRDDRLFHGLGAQVVASME
jgi:hypothetical protein